MVKLFQGDYLEPMRLCDIPRKFSLRTSSKGRISPLVVSMVEYFDAVEQKILVLI